MSELSASPHHTREQVRALFLAQGFSRVGFTHAGPVEDRVTRWVAEGRHASMDYMARRPADRADPRTLLPGARTVICVGVAYPRSDGTGAIAAYARGEDYHRTMRAALERAVEALGGTLPGVGARICVDSAPLLERQLAARAGLGWIGRSTMLLDERHGPWMLLGAVLIDAELPPDDAVADRCGTCTACVDACPTGALDVERELDARRCLSYWTIEHRGALPAPWDAALGHRAFGCDDCLLACPFPRDDFARSRVFEPRADLVDPTPAELRARAEASFRAHFGSTPLERARKGGLLRNLEAIERAGAPAAPDAATARPSPPRAGAPAEAPETPRRGPDPAGPSAR